MGSLTIDTKVPVDEEQLTTPKMPPRPSPLLNWADEPWSRGQSEIVADSRKQSQILVRGTSTVSVADDEDEEDATSEEAADNTHILSVPQPQAIGEPVEGDSLSSAHSEEHSPQYEEGIAPETYSNNPYYYPAVPHDQYEVSLDAPYASTCYYNEGYGCECAQCTGYVPHQACECEACLQHLAPVPYGTEPCYYAPSETTTLPTYSKPRAMKFSPPPPPPLHAAICYNAQSHEEIMLRWYTKLVELGVSGSCPAPDHMKYTFTEWAARVNRWWDVQYYASMNPNSGKQSYRGFHDARAPQQRQRGYFAH